MSEHDPLDKKPSSYETIKSSVKTFYNRDPARAWLIAIALTVVSSVAAGITLDNAEEKNYPKYLLVNNSLESTRLLLLNGKWKLRLI